MINQAGLGHGRMLSDLNKEVPKVNMCSTILKSFLILSLFLDMLERKEKSLYLLVQMSLELVEQNLADWSLVTVLIWILKSQELLVSGNSIYLV